MSASANELPAWWGAGYAKVTLIKLFVSSVCVQGNVKGRWSIGCNETTTC